MNPVAATKVLCHRLDVETVDCSDSFFGTHVVSLMFVDVDKLRYRVVIK
jgi:hypothetical protein